MTAEANERVEQKHYLRFSVPQRLQHILLIASFTILALTGLPVTGADAVVLGLADELVDSGDKERVLADLAAELAGGDSPGGVTTPVDAAASELEAKRAWIDECYAGDDAATIIERLLAHPDPDAQAAGKIIGERSPHSVVVTLAGLRRARAMTLHEVLDQDRRLGRVFAKHPDFREGVRALLVDKDNDPRWADASVADVDPAQVAAAFGGEL